MAPRPPNNTTLLPAADPADEQAASLRTLIREWALAHPDVEPTEMFAHLMNLALQLAFAMGSSADQVAGHLHTMVDRATDIYGALSGGTSLPS